MLNPKNRPNIKQCWLLASVGCWLFSGILLAAESAPQLDLSAVARINLINPEDGVATSCTGVLIAPTRVVTAASCVVAEETARLAKTVQVCLPRSGSGQCYSSKEILSHSGYLGAEQVHAANNLAYIELQQPVSGVQTIKELSPTGFEALLTENIADLQTFWIGYDSQGISSRTPISETHIEVRGLEYDYPNQRFSLDTADILPGRHYQGSAILIQLQGQTYLVGLVSSMSPDRIVHYYPEVNPCDEDPVIVRYPEPVIRTQTVITAYPKAACGMLGFQSARGFSELSCKRMERRTSLERAIQARNATAMRQKAAMILAKDDLTDDLIDLYQLLQESIALGDQKARVMMADILMKGEVIPADPDAAQQLLAESTNPAAQLIQARELLKAYVDTDMRSINSTLDGQLFTVIDKAARAGYPEAQYFLGRLYQFGIGAEVNNRTAYQWYSRAAMQGEPRAQFQIGTMWVDGRGVRSYPEVGHYWIRQAAARGYIKAQNYLALNKGQQTIDNALSDYEFEYSDT